MVEFKDRNCVVDRTLSWAEEIGVIAGPLQPNDTRESWLARAARKSRISYRQCKALFYGQTKDPRYSVASKILSAADRARIDQAKRDGEHLANIYQNLSNIDADFYRVQIDAFVSALRGTGSGDST